jgi:hypothetical protein
VLNPKLARATSWRACRLDGSALTRRRERVIRSKLHWLTVMVDDFLGRSPPASSYFSRSRPANSSKFCIL